MNSTVRSPRIAIVGLGNMLMADDGLGVHALRLLQQDPPADAILVDIGTRALAAQSVLEEAEVVIAIDAVHAEGPAGSIYWFDAESVEAREMCSLHDLGVIGLLQLMPEDTRPKVIIVGVEPEIIDYGMELSSTVQTALRRVVEIVRKIVEEISKDCRRGIGT